MEKTCKAPTGRTYNIYDDMLEQIHLLIAGKTGAGKSVVISGIMNSAMYYGPTEIQFILLDPKLVELIEYKDLPHTLRYSCQTDEMIKALEYAIEIMNNRYHEMQAKRIKKYDGSHIYVIIDELADLMTTVQKQVEPLIQRLCQLGRACNIHVIAATQCPLASIISTPIKVNIDSRVALKTRSAQDSRNIIEMSGCEKLPEHGSAYYRNKDGQALVTIPMVDEAENKRLIKHWEEQKRAFTKKKGLFARLFG